MHVKKINPKRFSPLYDCKEQHVAHIAGALPGGAFFRAYHKKNTVLLVFFLVLVLSLNLYGKQDCSPSKITQVVFLGTGTPNPDPGHSGNSVAIIVNDTPYIIDCGPGLIRKAAALSTAYGGKIEALNMENIKRAFITHLHSDHTSGYADLILTPWVIGRDEPLQVYGPEGIKEMTRHILEAYKEDIRMRLYGLEAANNRGWKVMAREIEEGIIYKDQNVTVEAFLVKHGSWPEAYGFKFTTPDRTIAISGDTRVCKNLIEKCKGVDILVHEVFSAEKLKIRSETWQKYHTSNHTSTYELAKIADQVKPCLLILYHQLYWGASDEDLLKEIGTIYKGRVVSAEDLDVY
ncbi:MAG: MBL fold metallo-hydrolase [Candidatus Aminicenantes bacterium]|nr:MBL fold metallo-hydrolase [Candidatus Aminicenantes bacterium]